MPEIITSRRLDQPRSSRTRFEVDPDWFPRLSERIARFLGTGRFLVIQSLIVLVWIALNLSAVAWRWDPYPFILLNLAFSTQAAYAAPLILLAQNRQDDRDRVSLEEDRARAAQTKADTEYLARELAALRIALGEVATRDYLRSELERLADRINGKTHPDRAAPDKARPDKARPGRTSTDRSRRGQDTDGAAATVTQPADD
ncbi:DUF1003 domain-containing protein [Pseudonocardia alaniniphila]|uniref:DUF1003 domain-containing protein n=1 Tax=Pseudonocardia alaniniphila TaxID=75291 RepID=A0ABS9TIH4_9PSEU|nr:DUF1003 domain-containing protein [Pseudonocardia alaniniphila]MCH6168218.1 DUF1003 domain-containing protein [Pseudonocardia alaniniphila]